MNRYLMFFVLLASTPMWAADGFDGTWVHSEDGSVATATIRVQNGQMQGQVSEDGEVYPFTGTVVGNRANILLTMDGETIPASLVLVNDELVAELDGDRYRYLRMQPPRGAAPPAQPQATPVPVVANRPQTSPDENSLVVLERKTLTDPGVNNMPSHTILVPKGWKVKGGGWWAAPAFFKVMPSQDITITAPSGVEVQIAPHIAAFDYRPSVQAMNLGSRRPAEGNSENGYPVVHQPDDDATWRQKMAEGITRTWPDATNVTVEDIILVPPLTALLEQRLAPIKAQGQPGSFCTGAVFASSIRYTSIGHNWEQLNIFGITNIGFDSDFGRNLYWTIEPNVMYRAPAGQLEAALPLLTTIVNSIGYTPEWTRMVNEHSRKINQAASFKPSVISDAGKSVSDIMFEGWQKREGIKDQSQRRVIETIREVTTYNNGDNTVQLPTGYQNVYSNGQGGYILSNNSLYQPGTDPSINHQQWQTIHAVP